MSTTALLVIDIQRGAFDGVRCPPIDRPAELVANASSLIAAARDAGSPVVFIQHCDEPSSPFEEGTPHWELHEQLVPSDSETVIKKYASSSFENTNLGETLQRLAIKDLILCGLQSEFCVRNTGNAALDLGYTVRIAQDGHSTWPSEGKSSGVISENVNEELAARGAIVMPTTNLAAMLRARIDDSSHRR
jgi:nicotinamidase-related amidase